MHYCNKELKKCLCPLCGLQALSAILSHVEKDMVDRSVTASAAIDMAKREEQLPVHIGCCYKPDQDS